MGDDHESRFYNNIEPDGNNTNPYNGIGDTPLNENQCYQKKGDENIGEQNEMVFWK